MESGKSLNIITGIGDMTYIQDEKKRA